MMSSTQVLICARSRERGAHQNFDGASVPRILAGGVNGGLPLGLRQSEFGLMFALHSLAGGHCRAVCNKASTHTVSNSI